MRKLLFPLFAVALLAGCDAKTSPTKERLSQAGQDTAVVARTGQTVAGAAAGTAATAGNAWDLRSARLADVKYPEITRSDVRVRGDDAYNVYSVDETVLFDTDKADIKPSAGAALREITGSIGQRYATREVRVMGFTDSRGSRGYNRELSAKRAEAVKDYLVRQGKIEAARVSVEPMGDAQPVASNATAAGRQENRRVEIAVRTK